VNCTNPRCIDAACKIHYPEPKRRFYLKFSGSAFGIEADTPEQAVEQIRKILDCYATITTLEIGVDVDELGWPIRKEERATA
jgi:hypothetical protein